VWGPGKEFVVSIGDISIKNVGKVVRSMKSNLVVVRCQIWMIEMRPAPRRLTSILQQPKRWTRPQQSSTLLGSMIPYLRYIWAL